MKLKIVNPVLILFLAAFSSCVTPSGYTVKVMDYKKNWYAEWGKRDGKPFEDRYDAIVCEVSSGKQHVCKLAVYQHWFKKNRKNFPAVGSEILIMKSDFREQMFPDKEIYSIELDEFENLMIGNSNKTSGISQQVKPLQK